MIDFLFPYSLNVWLCKKIVFTLFSCLKQGFFDKLASSLQDRVWKCFKQPFPGVKILCMFFTNSDLSPNSDGKYKLTYTCLLSLTRYCKLLSEFRVSSDREQFRYQWICNFNLIRKHGSVLVSICWLNMRVAKNI